MHSEMPKERPRDFGARRSTSTCRQGCGFLGIYFSELHESPVKDSFRVKVVGGSNCDFLHPIMDGQVTCFRAYTHACSGHRQQMPLGCGDRYINEWLFASSLFYDYHIPIYIHSSLLDLKCEEDASVVTPLDSYVLNHCVLALGMKLNRR